MKKIIYMAPAITVIKLDMNAQLLNTSPSVTGEGVDVEVSLGWGGDGTGHEAGSRESDWDD